MPDLHDRLLFKILRRAPCNLHQMKNLEKIAIKAFGLGATRRSSREVIDLVADSRVIRHQLIPITHFDVRTFNARPLRRPEQRETALT